MALWLRLYDGMARQGNGKQPAKKLQRAFDYGTRLFIILLRLLDRDGCSALPADGFEVLSR